MNDSIDLLKFVILKEEVEKLSKVKKKQLLMFSLILSDLSLQYKFLISCKMEIKNKEEVITAAKKNAYIHILMTLVSKLYEAFLYIDKIEVTNEWSTELSDLYNQIEFFFNEKNKKIFNKIRNKLSFHYDKQRSSFDNLVKTSFQSDFKLYLGKEGGNNVFQIDCCMIIILDIMRKQGFDGADQDLSKQLFEMVIKVTGYIQGFCNEFLIARIFNSMNNITKQDVTVPAVSFDDAIIPFFIKKPD